MAWTMVLFPAAARASEPEAKPASAWVPSEDDAWLFALRVGKQRLSDALRAHDGPDGLCIDFGDLIRATDLPIRLDRQVGRASGWAFDEGRTLVVDREAGTMTVAGETTAIARGSIHDVDDGWCVAAPMLEGWLGVAIAIDRSNAILTLSAETPLPFERAAARREQAAKIAPARAPDIARFPRHAEPYHLWRAPMIDVDIGVSVARTPGAPTRIARRYAFAAHGEVAAMSVAARLSSDDRGRPAQARLTAYRVDGEGRLPLGATEVQLGDISVPPSALALGGAVGRGIAIGNRPVGQTGAFDTTEFRGNLASGWDVELYHNGRLVGLRTDDGSGRFHFADVPLLFGANRFEIVHHGPRGEIRREVVNRPVGAGTIPVGQTRWWASALEAGKDLIPLRASDVPRETSTDQSFNRFRNGLMPGSRGWRFGLGIDHGLTRTSTLSATVHALRDQDRWLMTGDAVLRQSIGPGVAEFGGAYASDGSGAVSAGWIGAIGGVRVRAGAVGGFGGYAGPRLAPGDRMTATVGLDRTLKLGKAMLPLSLVADWRWRVDGTRIVTIDARASTTVAGIAVTGGVQWRHDRDATSGSGQDRWSGHIMANARIGSVRLRGEVRAQRDGAPIGQAMPGPIDREPPTVLPSPGRSATYWQAALTADGTIDDRTSWRAQAGWAGGQWRLAGGLVRDWRAVRVQAQGSIDAGGGLGFMLGASLALGPDEGGRWRMRGGAMAESARIAATVFVDTDGDGTQDPGEPGLPDVAVVAGNRVATVPTDATGRTLIEGVERDRPILVQVDAASIADPMIRPAPVERAIVARAGVITRVALPVVATGAVETTLLDPDGEPVAGAAVELVGERGAVVATAISEFDGFIAFDGVPHGRWRLRLAEEAARLLGALPSLADAVALDAVTSRIVIPPVRWSPAAP